MCNIEFFDIDDSKEFFTRDAKLKKLKSIEKKLKKGQNGIVSIKVKEEVKKMDLNKQKKLSNLINIIKLSENNKDIYENFIEDVLKKVISLLELVSEEQEVYFLVKKNRVYIENLVKNMREKYKILDIVTNKVNEFSKMEDENVIILNNKRKSLKRAKFIINIDFNENEINDYCINRNAIVFNESKNAIKNIVGFDGIIINNIEFFDKEYEIKDLYLASNNKNVIADEIKERINNGEMKFIGNNGAINLTK